MARCLPWKNSSKAGDFLVAAGLMPSFEEFCKETDKELEQILKRRNTSTPFIKNLMTSKLRKLNDSTAQHLRPSSVFEMIKEPFEPELQSKKNSTAELPSYPLDDLAADSFPSFEDLSDEWDIEVDRILQTTLCSPHSAQNLAQPQESLEEKLKSVVEVPWVSSKHEDLYVAAGLVPSFEDFSKECEKELEQILQRRDTCTPCIKILTSQQEVSTETLHPASVDPEPLETPNEEDQNSAQILPPSQFDTDTIDNETVESQVALFKQNSNKCTSIFETSSTQTGILGSIQKTKFQQVIRLIQSNEDSEYDPDVSMKSCYFLSFYYVFLVLCGIFRFYLSMIANI